MSPSPLFALLILCVLVVPSASAEEITTLPTAAAARSSLDDILPLTAGNLRGHRALYDEGWFIVTSSRQAFAFAKEKSLISSAAAMQQVLADYAQHTGDYKEGIKEDVGDAVAGGKKMVSRANERSLDIYATTHAIAQAEYAYSKESFQKAMDSLVKGNLSLGKRTEKDRHELVNLRGNYYKKLKGDFSNIRELTDAANDKFANKIEIGWDRAFSRASQEFRAEYEHSGTQANSLLALGPILSGYLKAFYHGLAAPTAKTIVKGGAKGTTEAIFLPVATATVATGRTIESVGLTLYYTGSTGVKVVAPTVEGGLLAGLSLLSLSTVPPTYLTGGSVGAMNQVAFSIAGPTSALAEGVKVTTVDTAKYVSFLAYDSGKGVTRVVINQAHAGVVLGYNALTAIPAHLFTGALDTVVLLAYDGPSLIIASARGKVGEGTEGASLGELPVGTVLDLNALQQHPEFEVKILSDESAVLSQVLEKLPEDLKVPPPPEKE